MVAALIVQGRGGVGERPLGAATDGGRCIAVRRQLDQAVHQHALSDPAELVKPTRVGGVVGERPGE